ncbi:MAG: hypothetical protein LQ338_003114 [Usnochroma carphineum]|nr:MAG: hypothetical protein LQ338_003114 [Usnochroma carphineum]
MSAPNKDPNHVDGDVSDGQIRRALEVIHDARSPNSLRQKASLYLERVKSDEEAPYHGYKLAADRSQAAIVRHYGLSLLENAVRHRWAHYSVEQSTVLRDWELSLAETVTDEDPFYIRTKIASTWVEIAKRSWALDWMDMDERLVRLWDGSLASKELVLTILETLSEDIFGHEDATAGLRGTDLNRACVDIFTPMAILLENFPSRETSINVRYGDEGWLSRMANLLELCVTKEGNNEPERACAVRILGTLRSVIGWVIPKSISTCNLVTRLCQCLASPYLPIQLAAVDVLYYLYNHSRFADEDFKELVGPIYMHNTVDLLQRLYEWSCVDAADIDEEKYLLSKKLSEMIYNIGRLLDERPNLLPVDSSLDSFLRLLINIARNNSLQVSITALHVWVKILSSDKLASSTPVTSLIGELLEVCSQRMIKYDALPDDSSNPSIIFLNQDLDTMPERRAFLGNYKRFCKTIVERIVQQQPADALYHILSQAEQVITHLYDGEMAFNVQTYTKTSVPFLKLDAQCSVVDAALKGSARWLTGQGGEAVGHEQEIVVQNLKVWTERILGLHFEDPLVKERVIQLAVGFATGPLKKDTRFALSVFDYILGVRFHDNPSFPAYSEAVKDLQSLCIHELQRLAMKFADFLITIFDDIERKVTRVIQETAHDAHTRSRYYSILFIITHRAASVDPGPRQERLEMFLQPLVAQWQSDELTSALGSFNSFCDLLGCGGIQQYVSQRALHQIPDWSSYPLDDEGKALSAHMQDSVDRLPLRATKIFLSASVENLDQKSPAYELACRLWQENLPLILPNLLRSIKQAHAFHDASNWNGLPPEMSGIVRRILTDRFWQVGISTGSRDEFYAKVGDTKNTMEGWASSVRATVRAVRETGYKLLFYMSLLGDRFYSYKELPGPLAQALFADAGALSTHQMAYMVENIRPIIESCPVASRSHFLPPILANLFEQLDRKASAEWDKIEQRTRLSEGRISLDEEMRDESILRQMTYSSVMLVVGLLDPHRPNPPSHEMTDGGASNGLPRVEHGNIRDFIIATPEILKPLILFCTHAIRMRDTRSCSLITRVLSSLVKEFDSFAEIDTEVREFISTEVLKACITSLHDSYFVELQKDLAQLIASILLTYTPKTNTPREILLSLPSMPAEKVDRALQQLYKAHQNTRQQRAIVLNLLESLRGISISEQGKIAQQDPKKVRSAIQERYMTVEVQTDGKEKETTPDLGGVADMFGQP